MKRVTLITILYLATLSLFAQETRNVGSFRGIKSSQAIDVYLKKGDKESVRVTGSHASHVITEVVGDYLKIYMERGTYRNTDAKVYVTYVSLNRISASSASNVFSDGEIKSNALDIDVSSAASVELSINVQSAEVEVSSAGEVVLEGKATELTAEASSAGELDAYALESDKVEASASSAGGVKVNVSKELNARASSGGSIRYRGSPARTNSDSSSGGSVKKSN